MLENIIVNSSNKNRFITAIIARMSIDEIDKCLSGAWLGDICESLLSQEDRQDMKQYYLILNMVGDDSGKVNFNYVKDIGIRLGIINTEADMYNLTMYCRGMACLYIYSKFKHLPKTFRKQATSWDINNLEYYSSKYTITKGKVKEFKSKLKTNHTVGVKL